MSGAELGLTEEDHERLSVLAERIRNGTRVNAAERVELECELCGDTFVVKESRSDQRFCSLECVWEYRNERVELTCEACDETFEAPPSRSDRRFCSWECSHQEGLGGSPGADS